MHTREWARWLLKENTPFRSIHIEARIMFFAVCTRLFDPISDFSAPLYRNVPLNF